MEAPCDGSYTSLCEDIHDIVDPPTTTTTAAPTLDGVKARIAETFPPVGDQLAEAMRGEGAVEAVRSITYDPTAHAVLADILSEYDEITPGDPDDFGRQLIVDQAWDLTQALAPLWGEAFTQIPSEFAPSYILLLEDLRFACPADLMFRFAAASAGRQDFDAGCEQP